jgi:hypothetical protein
MLTEEMKDEILRNEGLIARILEIRNPRLDKKWWESAVLASLLTAIVTATITIGGGYVLQSSAKSRDIKEERFEFERNKKREFLARAYDLIAQTLKSSDDRLALAKGVYDNFRKEKLTSIAEGTNLADARWRSEREPTEFYVYLYYGNKKEMLDAWNTTRASIQAYCDCAEEIYERYQSKQAPPTACKERIDTIAPALETFRKLVADDYRAEAFPNE